MVRDRSEYFKQYRIDNKERISDKNRRSYLRNKEKVNARSRKYYKINKELLKPTKKEQDRLRYLKDGEKLRQQRRNRYCNDPKIEIQKTRDWEKLNQNKVRGYDQRRHAMRRGWGYEPLNNWFPNSNFHHLHTDNDHSAGLYIPKELHKSISHRFNDQESMNMINQAAIRWVFENDS